MNAPQWIHAAPRRDLEAFNTIIQEYQDRVYSLVFRVLDDEIAAAQAVQNAFLRAFRDFKSSRIESLRPWLYRYAVQEIRSALRSSRSAGGSILESSPEASLVSLPPELRLVAVLVEMEGMNYSEAGAILGWPPRTVSSRLAQARSSLIIT